MPAVKGASTTSVGASGRSNGKVKAVTFRGLKLTLPSDPPGDLAFSVENNEVSAAIQAVFGDETPDVGKSQYVQIREKCIEDKLTLQQTYEALAALLRDCFKKWDITEGE